MDWKLSKDSDSGKFTGKAHIKINSRISFMKLYYLILNAIMKHILVLKIGSRIGLEYGLGLELWELEGSCLGLRFLNPTYWQVVQHLVSEIL